MAIAAFLAIALDRFFTGAPLSTARTTIDGVLGAGFGLGLLELTSFGPRPD
jgi:hypothetical protein